MAALTQTMASEMFYEGPERYLDVGDSEVAYWRVGSGPDVLFVHGWPVSSATFRALLPQLAPHVTCHLIDLPGAGHSRFDRDTALTVARHIERLREVVTQLRLTRFAAVGHDSGGLMARHAFAGDGRLRALGLLDTEQPQRMSWRFRQLVWVGQHMPGFARALAWAGMRPTLRKNPLLFGGCFTDQALLSGEFEAHFLAPLRDDPERRWAAGALMRGFELRYVKALPEVHARISAPVQLVWGEDDPFFPVAWARDMVSTFADARLHVVKGAKLFAHEERPEEVARALLPVLRDAP